MSPEVRPPAEVLYVKHTQTFDDRPLAVVGGLHFEELTPTELRSLAAVLLDIADDCDRTHATARRKGVLQREYVL